MEVNFNYDSVFHSLFKLNGIIAEKSDQIDDLGELKEEKEDEGDEEDNEEI